MEKTLPRGLRNNNPLNIKKCSSWIGERPVQRDKTFEEFIDIIFGLRAGFCLLNKYINVAKCNTIEKIISRWAPSTENATQKYIDYVSKRIDIPARQVLNFGEVEIMVKLVQAMCFVECGCEISEDLIRSAYWVSRVMV